MEDGTAYFGAGIFPHENVYLHAVRAEDGAVMWKNDTISQESANRNELSPQGYLLAAQTELFVPSGRALPAAFSRATGQLIFQRSIGWGAEQAGGLIGGTYALLADDQIYTGTQKHLLALDQKTGAAGFAWFPGRKLTVAGAMACLATGQEIMAMDRSAYARASKLRNALEFKNKQLQALVLRAQGEEQKKLAADLQSAQKQLEEHKETTIAPSVNWSQPSACEAELILCGNRVIAGGQDEVVGLNLTNGTTAWSAKVDGRAAGLALANGRLYVSTDTGKIYCFGAGEVAKGTVITPQLVRNPYPEDELTPMYAAAAESIIAHAGVTQGYCLVLGSAQGRLALELARRSELKIVGIESNPATARAAKEALDRAGLYGTRIVIHEGNPQDLPYSSYFANLIVSDQLLLTGEIPGDPARLARHVKPWGGVICLGSPGNVSSQSRPVSEENLQLWLARLELGPCRIDRSKGTWATLRRGPLPGAGRWTHQYAEPGNTACGDDQLVGGSLGLLWFGEPGTEPMVNRHDAAAAPLALNGRLFIQGENNLMAYDAFNGRELWKRDLPGAMRTRLKARECGNLAAAEDSFFVALGDRCERLDAETGRTLASCKLPVSSADGGSTWGYLAYAEGILYGSASRGIGVSDSVFAIDAATGAPLWIHQGKNIVNLTIAVGGGWVFFIDSSISSQQREALLQQDKSRFKNLRGRDVDAAEKELKSLDVRLAVALDARTGGKVWAKPVDVTDCSRIGSGGGELTAMYRDGTLVLCGANANGHYWKQFLAGEFSRRRLVALAASNGEILWAKDAEHRHRPVVIGDMILAEPWIYDLKTGRQKVRANPVTGVETAWQFLRPGHHCGAISASPQMLLMRSGSTSYYDLRDDSGIRHFAGHRPGCWINAIPANGLVLIPEAAAGCVCLHPINCTVVLEPRPDYPRWAIYSAGGTNTPVRHLAVNLGAPGDRRDPDGKMWFAFPRPALPGDRADMGLSFNMKTEFAADGGYFLKSGEAFPSRDAARPWLFASGGRGIRSCVLPLLGENDEAATYVVRLYFAEPEEKSADQRVFDVAIQGQEILTRLNISKEAGGCFKGIVREFPGIAVQRNLEIEMHPSERTSPASDSWPLLCGLEVQREK